MEDARHGRWNGDHPSEFEAQMSAKPKRIRREGDLGFGLILTPPNRRWYLFKMGFIDIAAGLVILLSFGIIQTDWELRFALMDATKQAEKHRLAAHTEAETAL